MAWLGLLLFCYLLGDAKWHRFSWLGLFLTYHLMPERGKTIWMLLESNPNRLRSVAYIALSITPRASRAQLTPGGFFPDWPFAGNGDTFRNFSGSLAGKILTKVLPRKSCRDLGNQNSRQDLGFWFRREISFAAFVKTWRDLTRPVDTNNLARLLPFRQDFSEHVGTF